jgi:uncharacterized protein
MKESRFIYFVEKKGIVLCYSTMHNTIIAIPPNTYNSFKDMPLEEFAIRYPNSYKGFVENRLIIENNIDELAELRLRNKMATFYDKHFDLTVLPSMDCNLHCWYCFEDHVPDSRMSKDVQERIIKHISNKVDNKEISSLSLEYFGGEPLLDFNKIAYPLGMSLKSVCEQQKLKFNCFFITNSTLITDEMIGQLAELNAGFQITLDGDKNRHDTIRFRKQNNQGTYDHIIGTIYKLTEQIENTYINIRINYDDKTLENIEEVLSDLSDLDRKKVGVHFERVWQTSCTNKTNPELKNIINLFLANDFNVSYLNWHPRGCSCKVERMNQLAVNYDGKVFKCTGRKYTDEHSDGELDENGEILWKPGRLEQRLGKATFENDMCLKCKMLPVCMGPCSQKQIDVGPDRLKEVCALNTLEMKIGEYIEYTYNNMVAGNNRNIKI